MRPILKIVLCPLILALLLSCTDDGPAPVTEPFSEVTIYTAQTIHTMNPLMPSVEAVAIRGKIIAGVGTVETLRADHPDARVDRQFADHTIVPGLIDPHMHVLLGSIMYALPFATPWPMALPDGKSQGYPTRADLLQRLTDIAQNAPQDASPLFVYGYHNLLQGDLTRTDLDNITSDRPLLVWHYSGHDFYLNTKALELAGVTVGMHDQFEGIGLTSTGELSGRIFEDALPPIFAKIGPLLFTPENVQQGADRYFEIIRNAGITTTAEMAYGAFSRPLEDQIIANHWSLKGRGFRLYLIPEYRAFATEFGTEAPLVIRRMAAGEMTAPAPVLPRVKFFTDAAFYSQTMRLSEPGYLAGQSVGTRGLWVLDPETIAEVLMPYWTTDLGIHIHSNGDAAQTATLSALEQLRTVDSDDDFVIEHGGLFSPAHIQQAAELDAMVSAASYYVYLLSQHYQEALGEERGRWISPLGDLSEAGVTVTLHSDAPLAPPQPLRAAGVHITRATREGVIYEIEQALSKYDALEAITLDAAHALGLDTEIGSIEPGKKADFTILTQDPLQTPGVAWSTIGVWGTVLDGEVRALP